MYNSDFEEPLMQYPDYITYKRILLIVPPILLVVGTLGNIFSFIILMKNVKKASTYSYLSVLSIVDLLVLYVGLFRNWLGQFMIEIENMNNVLCKTVKFLGYFSSDTSVWLIVAVTVERAIVVMCPLKAQILCNNRNARLSILAILFVFLLVNCHFLWTIKLQHFPYNGTLLSICHTKPAYSYLLEVVWPWIDAGIYSFVPFIIIIVLNTFIIKKVISTSRSRGILRQYSFSLHPQHRPNGEMSTKITLMLLVVSFTFLVTTLPMVVVLIYTSFADDPDNDEKLAKRKLYATIGEMLMYTNHSINFILYCTTGKKFRKQFKALICCCKLDSQTQTTRSSSDSYKLSQMNTTDIRYARSTPADNTEL